MRAIFAILALFGCGSAKGGTFPPGENDGGADTGMLTGNDASNCDPKIVRCSGDLHSVVDCAGNVIKTCPPTEGCGGGDCVPACQSAIANQSTVGCDYYAYEIDDMMPEATGNCYAAFVANTWNAPVKLEVELAGQMLDVSKFARLPKGSGTTLTYEALPNGEVPPGKVAILFLADLASEARSTRTYCPITPALTMPIGTTAGYGWQGLKGTMLGSAFHVKATAPVTAYDIFPYGGGAAAVTSASLLLPSSAWGDNYIGVAPWRPDQLLSKQNIAFLSQEDGTMITILPAVTFPGAGSIATASSGVPQTYTVQKGEVLQLSAFASAGDLTGSVIKSSKPIAVVNSAACALVRVGACDSLHQQLPPVRALGNEYVAVRYRNRVDANEEAPPWRLVGAADGTTLEYDPSTPPGAPTKLAQGEAAFFDAAGPFVVSSQDDKHPFYMSAQMTGCNDMAVGGYAGPVGCAGDPEVVNVVPADQFLDRYTFFTDPTYPETNLVMVRRTGVNVTLDCAGGITGWKPVGTSGKYEYTRIDLNRKNYEPQGNCDTGAHVISGSGPFGLTVWGWGTSATGGTPQEQKFPFSQAASYAYPAGMGLRTITSVVIPPVPK